MKILLVGNGDCTKGSAQCLIELAYMIKEYYKFDIVVINPQKNKLNDLCDTLGIKNYSLGYQEMICKRQGNTILFSFKYILKYLRYIIFNYLAIKRALHIDFSEIDIIHSNTTAVDFGAVLAKRLNKPHIWHIREFGKEDFNFYYFHKDLPKYINKRSDKIIAISEVVYKSWINKGIEQSKFIRLYDGVIGKRYENIKMCMRIAPAIRVIFCGGIIPAKGQHLLIEALGIIDKNKLKNIQVDFYGDGREDYIYYLKKLAQTLGVLEYIEFKGYVNDISSVLQHYNLGIVCSRSEGFGRVTVEYLLSGLCVLASNSGANPELLNDGEFGILFQSQNAEDLARVLSKILDNPCIINTYSIKSKDYAIKNYTLENNIQSIVDVYNEINLS